MSSLTPTLRPLGCWKTIFRTSRLTRTAQRHLTTTSTSTSSPHGTAPPQSSYRSRTSPSSSLTTSPSLLRKFSSHPSPTLSDPPLSPALKKKIKTYPPPPAAPKFPLEHLTQTQITTLDPTGSRTQLFSPGNPEAAKVGDILLVRFKSGDPFAGVLLNIRKRGVETGILLRGQLTRVGCEMWAKIYSPNVVGIEVVQRREKRARRARLYYMRKPKHDVGSVQNLVTQYQRQRAKLRSGSTAGGTGGPKK
ncbi:MAG: hypothetical protein M1817_000522 [Caeruleum heppii]|nr:MAG: hypothetical protein M1817_000522 [Caeruleum heppii]